jgi:hypothetical protein
MDGMAMVEVEECMVEECIMVGLSLVACLEMGGVQVLAVFISCHNLSQQTAKGHGLFTSMLSLYIFLNPSVA